jgi:Type III restriction enzyme, res subunit
MSNLFKKMLGIIYVQQKNDVIQIGGVATQSLVKDIQATWGTSKIHTNMFTDFGRKYLEFNIFYALEVRYMLQRLLKNRRNWTSRNAIISAIQQMEENTWLSNMQEGKEHPKILDRTKLSLFFKTPLPHQVDFFDTYEYGRAALGLRGYLLSAAAGSGKTLVDLMIAEMVHSDFVIIVSPNNAVYRVWDTALTSDDKREYKVKQARWIAGENKPYNKERFLITHFEGLEKLIPVARGLSGRITIVLDESHNFNEMKSNRTQLFIDLCHSTKSENVIWASGTPIKALGGECIPLLKTIDPLFNSKVEASFKQIFGINAQRALDILRHRMTHIKFDVEKAAVQNEKPIQEELYVKLPNGSDYTLDTISDKMAAFITERMEYYKKNYKVYEDVFNRGLQTYESKITTSDQRERFKLYLKALEFVKKNPDPRYAADEMKICNEFEVKDIMPALDLEHRRAFKGAKSVIKYVNLKVMGEALGGILGRARAQLHVEMLSHIDFTELLKKATKKTVVFTSYVEVVKACEPIFKALGKQPSLVYADTNKNLSGNIAAFEKDPNVDPVVATFNSLSTAVPLVMADLSIFLNVPFRDHELVQAKARTDRLGQDTQVKYVMVYLDTGKVPNISTRSKEILEWSREQVALILGQDYNGDIAKTMDGYIASLESLDGPDEYVVAFEAMLNDILEEELECTW